MSEGHGDPPADVRSFLPRPGEPVEEYAERLRTLHRDLTLVLQAVERGLAAAADPHAAPAGDSAPDPAPAPIEIVPQPVVEAAAPEPVEHAAARRPRGPRVEVLPPPSGEHGRHDRRDGDRDDRWIADAPPEDAHTDLAEDVETTRPSGRTETDAPRPLPRFPARPSAAEAQAPEREPEWVEHEPVAAPGTFTPPTFPRAGGAPQRLTVSPLVAGAFLLAWLVVVALLVALLVS